MRFVRRRNERADVQAMTQGERAIWAAAFVASLNRSREEAERSIGLGLRPLSNPDTIAASEAARAVRMARAVLPKLVEMPTEPKWREMRDEEVAMLREMLDAPEVKLR